MMYGRPTASGCTARSTTRFISWRQSSERGRTHVDPSYPWPLPEKRLPNLGEKAHARDRLASHPDGRAHRHPLGALLGAKERLRVGEPVDLLRGGEQA